MSLPVVIIGAGGHAKVLVNLLQLQGRKILGLTDIDPKSRGTKVLGITVQGDDAWAAKFSATDIELVNGLGSTADNSVRVRLFLKWKEKGFRFASLVHPSAAVAPDVEFSEGVQIMAGTIVQPGTKLGKNVILNTGSQVDHDCMIADHVHISPGAVLSGGVRVEEAAHVGAGAVIIQGIRVGPRSVIAAGAVLVRDLAGQMLAVGVPARPKPLGEESSQSL